MGSHVYPSHVACVIVHGDGRPDYSLIKRTPTKPQSTRKESEMYGPTGLQVHAGHWQHDALREANGSRRSHTDSDHLKGMEHAHEQALTVRLIAAAAMVLVALAVIVLI
jgi:hypothetical protein